MVFILFDFTIQIPMDGLPPGAPLFILGNPQYGDAAAIAPSNYAAQDMHGMMHMHEVQVRIMAHMFPVKQSLLTLLLSLQRYEYSTNAILVMSSVISEVHE